MEKQKSLEYNPFMSSPPLSGQRYHQHATLCPNLASVVIVLMKTREICSLSMLAILTDSNEEKWAVNVPSLMSIVPSEMIVAPTSLQFLRLRHA